MAKLLDLYQVQLNTDFAMLGATQQQLLGAGVDTQTYAASAPGVIAMCAGTKYADVKVTLERWDSRPPPATDEWEDRDELPWHSVAEGGPLKVRGFDGEHPGGLDVADVGRARVIVLATGRHRYRYSDDVPGSAEPERWLLRIFPDPDGLDAIAGPRRRLAGGLPFDVVRDSWQMALHGWATGGWTSLGIAAFDEIHRVLCQTDGPIATDQLLQALRGTGKAEHGWDTVYFGPPTPPPGYPFEIPPDEVTPELARVTDLSLHTLHDGLECLMRLGLLTRAGREGLLAPTATWIPAWKTLGLSPPRRALIQVRGLQRSFAPLEGDLKQVLRWAPRGLLTSSLQQVAQRLALSTIQVRGTAELLVLRRQMLTRIPPVDLDDHDPLDAELTSESPRAIE